MTKINSIKKEISKKDRGVSFTNLSKLIAEFFNGIVFQVDGEYDYES